MEDSTGCHWFNMPRSMPSLFVFERSTSQSLKGCIIYLELITRMTIFEAVILLFKKSCAKTTLSFSFWKNFKKNQPTGHDHIHIVG